MITRLRELGAVSIRRMEGVQEHVRFPLPRGLGDRSMSELGSQSIMMRPGAALPIDLLTPRHRRRRPRRSRCLQFPHPIEGFTMLDINLLRRDLAAVIARLETRKTPQPFLDVDRFSALEAERKRIQTRTEELQARRNALQQADRPGQGQGRGHQRADGRSGRHRRAN